MSEGEPHQGVTQDFGDENKGRKGRLNTGETSQQ